MRANARNWLEVAEKVHHYRRDQLPEALAGELQARRQRVRQTLAERGDAARLKLDIEALEDVLRRAGGRIYPKSSLVENVEFFLVAAIVIIGIRTYFVQPFKIPTNSMWPSYHGMTGQVYSNEAEEPGYIASAFRFVTQLAMPRRIDAPASGPVMVVYDSLRGTALYQDVPGRKWLVIPTRLREYQLVVGGETVPVRVPADFDLDKVLLAAFFDGAEYYPPMRSSASGRIGVLNTGRTVEKGERVLSFDILTGDQLFVDRVSYHFVKPKVGQGFVFRTRGLPELHRIMEQTMPGAPKDQYYIKRLVGLPGDTLEIQDSVLYRNGESITGSEAFDKNARREDRYPGYRNEQLLAPGRTMVVPPDRFAAFGDNSASSLDSRYWGTIPEDDVIGKPLMIYYPFTRRWGPAP